MYPVLFEVAWMGNRLAIPTYTAAISVALIVFCAVGWVQMRRAGVGDWISAGYVLAVVLTMLFGARVAAVALQGSSWAREELYALEMGHFYLLGGLLLGILAAWNLSKMFGQDPWRALDALAPAAALAMAVVRLGCFGAGCCFGKETTVPWAVQFPQGSPVHLYQLQYNLSLAFTRPNPVHPTQLYLFAVALAVFGLTLVVGRRSRRPGLVVLTALLMFLVSRCWIDCYRANVGAFSASRDQVFCILGIVVCLAVLSLRWNHWQTMNGIPG